MSWAKVDDRFHGHSKARRAREALALWVLALAWCADELTDGAVPRDMPDLLLPGLGEAFAAKLVEVGLWELTPTGYQFHDWLDYQPSARKVKSERAKLSSARSKAGRAGMTARWAKTDPPVNSQENSDNKPYNKPVANEVTTGLQNHNPVPDPVPVPSPVPEPEPRELASLATGARERAPASAREGLFEEPPKAPAKPAKARAAATPPPDPVPATGTPARRLYDAITQDRVLGPITRGPGDLAERLAQPDVYPGIDVLAEIKRAGAWAAGQRAGYWSDVRKALLSWLQRTAERAGSMPKAAPRTGSPIDAAFRPAERIDWQGRRVVGAAPLPPGSAFAKTKEEHEAEEDRLYAEYFAATQPVKRTP